MQIVIDIDEKEYEEIIDGEWESNPLADEFAFYIQIGTVLPKHGRLIDADKLKEVYETTEDAEYCKWTLYGVTSEIDDAPTIIEADKAESEDKE